MPCWSTALSWGAFQARRFAASCAAAGEEADGPARRGPVRAPCTAACDATCRSRCVGATPCPGTGGLHMWGLLVVVVGGGMPARAVLLQGCMAGDVAVRCGPVTAQLHGCPPEGAGGEQAPSLGLPPAVSHRHHLSGHWCACVRLPSLSSLCSLLHGSAPALPKAACPCGFAPPLPPPFHPHALSSCCRSPRSSPPPPCWSCGICPAAPAHHTAEPDVRQAGVQEAERVRCISWWWS